MKFLTTFNKYFAKKELENLSSSDSHSDTPDDELTYIAEAFIQQKTLIKQKLEELRQLNLLVIQQENSLLVKECEISARLKCIKQKIQLCLDEYSNVLDTTSGFGTMIFPSRSYQKNTPIHSSDLPLVESFILESASTFGTGAARKKLLNPNIAVCERKVLQNFPAKLRSSRQLPKVDIVTGQQSLISLLYKLHPPLPLIKTSINGYDLPPEEKPTEDGISLRFKRSFETLLENLITKIHKIIKRLRRSIHRLTYMDLRFLLRTIVRTMRLTPFDGKSDDNAFFHLFNMKKISVNNFFNSFKCSLKPNYCNISSV